MVGHCILCHGFESGPDAAKVTALTSTEPNNFLMANSLSEDLYLSSLSVNVKFEKSEVPLSVFSTVLFWFSPQFQ